MQERVVITGLGTVNPSGNNVKEFWVNLQVGKNSIKNISLFDTNDFKVKIAGECSIKLDDYFNSKELNKLYTMCLKNSYITSDILSEIMNYEINEYYDLV